MFHKLNILVLLVSLFNPMSALKADTIDLNEEIEGVWNVGNVSPNSSEVVASVNGYVTHGDRLRIRFVKGDCDTGNLLTTVYSHHDNPKLVDLKDQLVDGIFMGEDVVLEILFTVPLFNKQLAYVDMGWVQKDALKRILLAQKKIDLSLVDTEDFKPSEYFDIMQNSWPTVGLSDAIDKASMQCKSMTYNKLSSDIIDLPIENMINPVEESITGGLRNAASFDCNKATTETEKAICDDPELSALDKRMSKAYKRARGSTSSGDVYKSNQFKWLKSRDACISDKQCLLKSYNNILNELKEFDYEALQKADERVLNYLVTIEGVCSKLLVNGEVLPCKNALIQTEYQDGRIGFYFLEEGGSGKILTFSGSGLKQKKLSENVRVQPVDGVIQKDGILNVSGECYFENPYVGEANIKCVATDASGMPFEGHFLTDGSEPEIKDFTESSTEPLQKVNKTKIDLIKTVPLGNQANLRRIFGNYQRECTAQQDTDIDEKLEVEVDNLKQIKLLQGDTEMTVLTASFYCPGVGGIWSGSGGSPVYYIIDEFVYKTFGGEPYPFDITEDQTVLIQWHGGAECKAIGGQPYPNSAPCFSAIYWNNELNTFSIME